MANKSAQNLQNLQSMGAQAQKTIDAETMLADLSGMSADDGEEQVPEAGPDGEAKFGLGVAALGATSAVLIGPAGILVGAGLGYLQKKADQNMLDKMSKATNAATVGRDIQQSRIDGLREFAVNEADHKQLDGIQFEHDRAMVMGTSGIPELMAGSTAMTEKIAQSLGAFERDVELDAATMRAEEREIGREQHAVVTEKHSRFDPKMDSYTEITMRANQAVASLMAEDFSYSDARSAIVNFSKIFDATSAVLGGEVDDQKNMGNLKTQFESWLNANLEDGGAMLPGQRNDMMRTISRAQGLFTKGMRRQETKVMKELIDAGLPQHYQDQFLASDLFIVAPEFVPEIPKPGDPDVPVTGADPNAQPDLEGLSRLDTFMEGFKRPTPGLRRMNQ